MTQIQIGGRDYRLNYNMQAACFYEQMTGRNPLDLQQFDPQTDGFLTNIASLGYCMLVAGQKEVPEFQDLIASIDTQAQMDSFVVAITEEIKRYFAPSMADSVDAHDDEDGEEKND